MMGQSNGPDRHTQEREILPKRMQDLAQYVQEGKFEDCIIFLQEFFRVSVRDVYGKDQRWKN